MINLYCAFIGFALGIFFITIVLEKSRNINLEEIIQLQKEKEMYMMAFTEAFNELPKEKQDELLGGYTEENNKLDKKI